MANPIIPLFKEESLSDQTVTDEHIIQMALALDKIPGVKSKYNKFCTKIGVPVNDIADNGQLNYGVKTLFQAFKDSLQAWRAGRNTTTAKFQVFFTAFDDQEEGWDDMKEKFLAVQWKGLDHLQIKGNEQPPPKTVLRMGFPRIVTPKIYGRNVEVETLKEYFTHKDIPIVLVVAVGGQGKSTLALAFVNQLEAEGTNAVVTWLNGSDAATLTYSLNELCRHLNCQSLDDNGNPLPLDKALNNVGAAINEKRMKSAETGRWIIILDNMDGAHEEMKAGLDSFLSHNAFLIVTSRRADVVPYECELLRLDPLDSEAAKCLVATYLPKCSSDDVKSLCYTLDCYALGLRLAVVYIKYQQQHSLEGSAYSVNHYLQQLDSQNVSIVRDIPEYSQSTEAVFRSTMSQVQTLDPENIATFLLQVLSLVNPDGISIDYLQAVDTYCNQKTVDSCKAALKLLKTFALINVEEGIVTIHRIVQTVVKQIMKDDDILEPLLENLLATNTLEVHRKSENILHFVQIYEECREHVTVLKKFQSLDASLFGTMSGQCLSVKLLSFTTKSLATFRREEVYGESHEFTLAASKRYNTALKMSGMYQQAMVGMQECYEKYLQTSYYGPRSAETYRCLQQIGSLHRLLGNYEESRDTLQEALTKMIEIKGESHMFSLRTTRELAVAQTKCEMWDEAYANLQEVVKYEQKQFGPRHWRTLSTKTDLANVLYTQGKYEAAKNDLEGIIETMQESADLNRQSSKDLTGMKARKILARCFHALGDLRLARQLMTQVLSLYTNAYWETHPKALKIQQELVAWGEQRTADTDYPH